MVKGTDIMHLFQEKEMVKVSAPMVRYSKLEFRTLVRKYNCDLCFSPMIMADSYVLSKDARDVSFTTDKDDTPLVVQFAAKHPNYFINAIELVAPYCDGVDLNCGCPQRWAIQEGYGCSLLSKPEIVKDLILQARNRISKPFTVSAKIRILPDLRKSIDLCKQLESAGASFLTIHGRTPVQRTEPVNIAALCEIRKSVALPLIANGDVKTLKGAEKLQKDTGYQGVMSARGILQNPALYSGIDITPLSCIETWIKLGIESKMNFHWFHHHLSLMLEKTLPKCERKILTNLKTHADVAEHMSTLLNIKVPKNINF